MKTKKIRQDYYLSQEVLDRLKAVTNHSKAKKSIFVAKAVEVFLTQQGESELDQRYGKRLDKLTKAALSTRRDVEMILESLALFIRYMIAVNAHAPMPDAESQSRAHERFLEFVDQVGRKIAASRAARDEKSESEVA